MRTILYLTLAIAVLACVSAFAPTPALKLRATSCSPSAATYSRRVVTKMSAEDKEKEEEKKVGNDLISIAIDSFMKLFKKSEDNYPSAEPASGFTQTPTKPKRNKGEW